MEGCPRLWVQLLPKQLCKRTGNTVMFKFLFFGSFIVLKAWKSKITVWMNGCSVFLKKRTLGSESNYVIKQLIEFDISEALSDLSITTMLWDVQTNVISLVNRGVLPGTAQSYSLLGPPLHFEPFLLSLLARFSYQSSDHMISLSLPCSLSEPGL